MQDAKRAENKALEHNLLRASQLLLRTSTAGLREGLLNMSPFVYETHKGHLQGGEESGSVETKTDSLMRPAPGA